MPYIALLLAYFFALSPGAAPARGKQPTSQKAKVHNNKATSRQATTRKSTSRKATSRKATSRKATSRKATSRKAAGQTRIHWFRLALRPGLEGYWALQLETPSPGLLKFQVNWEFGRYFIRASGVVKNDRYLTPLRIQSELFTDRYHRLQLRFRWKKQAGKVRIRSYMGHDNTLAFKRALVYGGLGIEIIRKLAFRKGVALRFDILESDIDYKRGYQIASHGKATVALGGRSRHLYKYSLTGARSLPTLYWVDGSHQTQKIEWDGGKQLIRSSERALRKRYPWFRGRPAPTSFAVRRPKPRPPATLNTAALLRGPRALLKQFERCLKHKSRCKSQEIFFGAAMEKHWKILKGNAGQVLKVQLLKRPPGGLKGFQSYWKKVAKKLQAGGYHGPSLREMGRGRGLVMASRRSALAFLLVYIRVGAAIKRRGGFALMWKLQRGWRIAKLWEPFGWMLRHKPPKGRSSQVQGPQLPRARRVQGPQLPRRRPPTPRLQGPQLPRAHRRPPTPRLRGPQLARGRRLRGPQLPGARRRPLAPRVHGPQLPRRPRRRGVPPVVRRGPATRRKATRPRPRRPWVSRRARPRRRRPTKSQPRAATQAALLRQIRQALKRGIAMLDGKQYGRFLATYFKGTPTQAQIQRWVKRGKAPAARALFRRLLKAKPFLLHLGRQEGWFKDGLRTFRIGRQGTKWLVQS